MFQQINVNRAALAGLLATTVMTVLMYGMPLVGLPAMDLLGSLGSLVPVGAPYLVGGLIHLANGVILALIYAAFLAPILPGPRWARGALFSLAPWLFALVALAPIMMWLQSLTGVEASAATNPCAAVQAVNPCAPVNPCAAMNPCAVQPGAGGPGQFTMAAMSLGAHLVYGAVLGALYRERP
ncbi:MAG: hypothetical protein HYV61_00805 [Candidatus Rokubacteria bacterium]|nr:hypothetical protein [Candidatus Rokubacteria bacterium]MBI2879453.1 hypothetical protein [Candidatus Rokubacteria bacterium]